MRGPAACLVVAAVATLSAGSAVEILQSTGGLPARIVGAFEDPVAFQQSDAGQYFVFDRRAHSVYTVADGAAKAVVSIGAEPGRILDPLAFAMNPRDGSFAVADAPASRERIQTFTASGGRIGGFTVPGRELPRVVSDRFVLNGAASLQFDGESLFLNQPERGSLVTEMRIDGTPIRTFGTLRETGHESDRDVHLAFNVGLPLIDPTGGFYFVFVAGPPLFQKYDVSGRLLFERHVEGPETDEYLRSLPTTWTRRTLQEGTLLPVVPPGVRTAAVDRQGRLWVVLTQGVAYIYDRTGDKIRAVRFEAAGPLQPNSLFFTRDGRALVTPGCYEFPAPSSVVRRPSSVVRRRSSVVGRRSSVVGRRSSVVGRPSSVVRRPSSVVRRRSSVVRRRSSVVGRRVVGRRSSDGCYISFPIGPRSRFSSSGGMSNCRARSRMVSWSRMSAMPTSSVSCGVSVPVSMRLIA